MSRRQRLLEIACIFAVFFLDGAVLPPDVNEPYYLGKALHLWNPQWAAGDFFLQTADTHKVFFWTCGWLGLWLSLPAMAWTIRLVTWTLLAWSWRRLSAVVAPQPWFSVLSAALFVFLLRRYHLAGEWVIGGAEAKPLAFVLVFLGLEALLSNRWNRAWLLLGGASAVHVLAGGWTAITAGLTWLMRPADRPPLRAMLATLVLALVMSLPGLIPSLSLNRNLEPEVQQKANEIYVYHRLKHHLDPLAIPGSFVLRFGGLVGVWFLLIWQYRHGRRMVAAGHVVRDEEGEDLEEVAWEAPSPVSRLQSFVNASLLIAAVGGLLGLLEYYDLELALALLRFYWFRMSDVAVPLGVALLGCAILIDLLQHRARLGMVWLTGVTVAVMLHLGVQAYQHTWNAATLADQYQREALVPQHEAWRDVCDWIAGSGQIPPDARFLTPVMSQTFKWYTGRAEVVNWKEIPQDGQSLVEWWRRVKDVCGRGPNAPDEYWEYSLAELGAEKVRSLGEKYEASHVLTFCVPPLPLEVLYRNEAYAVYRLAP